MTVGGFGFGAVAGTGGLGTTCVQFSGGLQIWSISMPGCGVCGGCWWMVTVVDGAAVQREALTGCTAVMRAESAGVERGVDCQKGSRRCEEEKNSASSRGCIEGRVVCGGGAKAVIARVVK